MLLLNLILFILTSIVLMASATFVILSLNKIAFFLRISRFTASFIIVAFATAIPELFIGISSAISKNPILGLGNVLGSSMLHFTLLSGIFILMGGGIKIKENKISKDIYFVLGSIFLVIVLALINSSLSRIDGIILVSFFLLSSYRIFKNKSKNGAKLGNKKIKRIKIVKYFIVFFISLIILFITSKYIVNFASLIAIDLNLPKILIGMLFLSLATNLPELAFGFKAIKLGYENMALGDLIGGVLTNIGFVLGIIAIIYPIQIEIISFIIVSSFLLISAIIFTIFLKSGKKLKAIEGIGLILIYILFIIIEFLIK